MLVTIAWVVWFAIWGLIGYATVSAFLARIKTKREMEQMVQYWNEKRKLEKLAQTGYYNVIDINSIGVDIDAKEKGL